MPNYMFAHPVLGLATVTLILAAFTMKAGQHKFWTLHYLTGLLAGGVGITAFSAALLIVARRYAETGGHPHLPPVANLPPGFASLRFLAPPRPGGRGFGGALTPRRPPPLLLLPPPHT